MVEDPIGIAPARVLLNRATPRQQFTHCGPRFQTPRKSVPTLHDVLVSDDVAIDRLCSRNEHLLVREAFSLHSNRQLIRMLGVEARRTPGVIRARESDQHVEPRSGLPKLAGQSTIGSRSGARGRPDELPRRKVMPDQRNHRVHQSLRRTQAQQQLGRERLTGMAVPTGARATLSFMGRAGLPEVVAQGCEHQLEILVATVSQHRSGIDDTKRVHEDVTLRMPTGILRHAHECVELREEPQQPSLSQQREPARGLPREQQQLPPLRQQALGRNAAEIRFGAQPAQLCVRLQLEPCR
jgi:hypothetical protein